MNQDNKTVLSVLEKLQDIAWHTDRNAVSGNIAKLTQDDIICLKCLDNEGEINYFKKIPGKNQCNSDELNVEDNISIELKTSGLRIYEDFKHFISQEINLKKFYPFIICNTNVVSLIEKDNFSDKDILIYCSIIKLIDLLKEIADEYKKDITDCADFWYNSKKIELKITYSHDIFAALENLDFSKNIENLVSAFNSKSVYDKKIIFKKVFYKTYEPVICNNGSANGLFVTFLKSMERFYRDFATECEVSLSQFSFDQLRDHALEEENNFKKKLNDTFSNIQGKIIAIPVTGIIAIGQMKVGADGVNIALFIGAIIAEVLIALAIMIQYANLGYITKEVNGQKAKIKHYPCADSRLAKTYSDISKFVIIHKVLIFAFIAIGLFVIYITWRFLVYYTPCVESWQNDILLKMKNMLINLLAQ